VLDPHSPGAPPAPTCIKSGLRRVALARARHHSYLGYQWLAKSALARRQAKTFSNLPRQRTIPMTANFLAGYLADAMTSDEIGSAGEAP
jgi:hypothetical protein